VAESKGGSVLEVTSSRADSTSSARGGVAAPEGLQSKTQRYEFTWRPLAMHLIIGVGLLSFNNRLLRGWLYPCAFAYFTFVGGVCIGQVQSFKAFCNTDFSVASFCVAIGVYVLGFVDIALGVCRTFIRYVLSSRAKGAPW
jgi:hypothetical protein